MAAVATLVVSTGLVEATGAPPASPSAALASATVDRSAYHNPVSRSFADTFADPSVIRGKDGFWYSYGTSDPLREGDTTARSIPIARSSDLVSWTYVGDAFDSATRPRWADTSRNAALWAPDIRYVDGQYRMYYVVTETTATSEPNDNAIGMATAPTPTGPWTDSGGPVVGPRRGGQGEPGNFLWTFDPSVVTDGDGRQWMFYGSYYGGIYVTQLSADGRTTAGRPTQVAIDNKFEGAYAVHRNGWWYLFASTANCCAGPTTGYSVQVGRSRSVAGPYRDAQGVALTSSRAGGTPTLVQNGNAWVGAGHNAVVTDLAGQDWVLYHAINRSDPYLDGSSGINERPMLLDRLDWVRGWPAVRAGRGPSNSHRSGPATGGSWTTDFTGSTRRWRSVGSWTRAIDPQSGRHVRSGGPATLLSRTRGLDRVRVAADLRSAGPAYGLRADSFGSVLQVLVDPGKRRVELRQLRGSRVTAAARAALPAGFDFRDWHSLALEIRDDVVRAEVSNAGLGDPLATLRLRLRGHGTVGPAGATAGGPGVDVDNLSVLPAATLVTVPAAERVPHRLDRRASDEFAGSSLAAGWSWVRKDAAARMTSGRLRWPTEAADLSGAGNDAGLLLRNPGAGSWTIQTKVTTDFGVDTIRNFQQAGLVAYVNDDLFARLSTVAIWNTRQTEFGKEMPYAGGLSYGGTIAGPPAETTWLRLTHRVDPANGEHELRAWSSRDGRTWVKGGVWTLPARARLRVGLVSHGGAGGTAQFHYFRMYR
ncbi:MAG: family 43 glycosylhydrolase [Friedmanniella sp.]